MLSGFTIVRNAVSLDYPIVPALRSILEICDEVIVNVGQSADGTRDLVAAVDDPRVRIIDSVWDFSRGSGVLALETERAMRACRGVWGLYIQADEVLHETGAAILQERVQACGTDPRVEGLLVDYRHFYGDFDTVATNRHWYRREVRCVRLDRDNRSYQDAQGFRVGSAPRRGGMGVSSGPPCCGGSRARILESPRTGSPRGAVCPQRPSWPHDASGSGTSASTRRTGSSALPAPGSSSTATTSRYERARRCVRGAARGAGGGVQSPLPPERAFARTGSHRTGLRGAPVRGAAARAERRAASPARHPAGRVAAARPSGPRARLQGDQARARRCRGAQGAVRRPVGELVPRRPPRARRVARPRARLRLLVHARQLEPGAASPCRDARRVPHVRLRPRVPPAPRRRRALAGAPCVRGITRPRARAGRPGARRAGPGRVGPGVAERARVRRRLRAGALGSHRRPEHPPAFRGGGRPSPLR